MTTLPTGVDPTEDGTPPLATFRTDLSRFTTAGLGIVREAAAGSLRAGQIIAVTDDDADTLEAEVLAVRDGEADVRVHWDRVLRRA